MEEVAKIILAVFFSIIGILFLIVFPAIADKKENEKEREERWEEYKFKTKLIYSLDKALRELSNISENLEEQRKFYESIIKEFEKNKEKQKNILEKMEGKKNVKIKTRIQR